MKRHFSNLERIDNNEPITKETHSEFLYHLQSALLLALREQGSLSPMQHRHAQETQKQHRWERAKRKQEEP